MQYYFDIYSVQIHQFGVFAIAGASSICNILYYIVFIPRYAAKHMGMEKWIFYPHILRTFLFAIVMLLLLMPIVNRLDISNWFIFFLACGVAEIIGIVMYLFIVLKKKDREFLKSYVLCMIKR